MMKRGPRRHQTRELLDFQAKLKSLHEISGLLSQSATFDDFCRLAIDLGLSRLGFDRLGLWFLGADSHSITGSFGTDENGQIRDERGEQHDLLPEHLTGEMLQPGVRRTVLHHIPLLNGKSRVVGYGDVVRGNLWDGEQVLGWLNADNLIRRQPWTDYQIELLGLYAETIGHLVTRKRIEDSLRAKEEEARRFQDKLKVLHEVTTDLAQTSSFDELCLRAVEWGRSKLGFDRLSLWFLDSNPQYMIGSFGTDENGQIRDERNQRIQVPPGESVQELLAGRVFAPTRFDVPLYNDRHEVVGQGWKAVAQMWNGYQNIGWVSVDNLLSHKPLIPYELEVLSLYADTLGHLATVRKTEAKLAAERALLRTIIDTVPDLIYVKDTGGRFMLVNRACWEETPQVSNESDLIGKNDYDIFSPLQAEHYQAGDRQVMQSGVPVSNVEEPGRYQNGQERTLLTTKVPLRDDQGSVIGVVGVSHDISDLKQVARQTLDLALERERINVLKETITNISHDLRTPLTSINFHVYMLERTTDPEKQKGRLQGIKQQTTLLEHRIKEILLSARLEQGPPIDREPVNLSRLCAEVAQGLAPAAEGKQLAVVMELPPDLPDVSGDAVELERVLSNLIQNAITYTPEGGSIRLKTLVRDGKVLVEVSDTGIGISQDDLPYIFDHFYRADKSRSIDSGGMGLGLAIVKRIVGMHGGAVEVESTVGQGSLFRVLLPPCF